jgi:hypothetical protein
VKLTFFVKIELTNTDKGGIYNPDHPKEMDTHTNFPCHKEPPGSVYFRFYIWEMMRCLKRYHADIVRVKAYL